MQIPLSSYGCSFRLFFAASIMIISCTITVCQAEHYSSPRNAKAALRRYLVDRAEGSVASNTWPPKMYELMLRRLDESKKEEKYVYLYHERIGKHIVVYWFGIDENLPAMRVRLKSGKEIDAPILPAYRRQNAKDMRRGEPQYFAIALDDEATAKGVLSVSLIKEQTAEENGTEENAEENGRSPITRP